MFRSRLSMVAIGALAISLAVGTGVAIGTSGGDDTVFTGCLKNGKISDVAVGTEPTKPCNSRAETISWNASGRDGATWFSGVSSPADTLGENGDLFLLLEDGDTTAAGDVFVKQDGTWVTQATLRGPEGLQGPEGPEGPQGPEGPAGEPGTDGGVHFVDREEVVRIGSSGGVVLHLDVPAGLYTDAAGFLHWRVADPEDYNNNQFRGAVHCSSNAPGIAFGLEANEGNVGLLKIGSSPGTNHRVQAGDEGVTISCSHDIREILEDGTSSSRDVFFTTSETWMRLTPVAEVQTNS